MPSSRHRVLILGGGFGGLAAARGLRRADVDVTLVDAENFHLFQPLLYQVAIGGLAPADIAAPLRWVLRKQRNARVLLGRATGIDPAARTVEIQTEPGPKTLEYDSLIVAAGARNHYFGKDEWAAHAPALKTIADATEMRRRILGAFEAAELETDPERLRALSTFVVVGGGPTGVELAGAISELSRQTLPSDFRSFNPASSKVVLLEGGPRLLAGYDEGLSAKAKAMLEDLGVDVRLGTFVTDIQADHVAFKSAAGEETLDTHTVLWGAGVAASPLGRELAEHANATLDRQGRVEVDAHLALAAHPEIRVVGDLAHTKGPAGQPLPGVAPVALQQGKYVAKDIARDLRSEPRRPFRYRDKGNLATVGRSRAVAEVGRLRTAGFFAWLLWLGVHLAFLVGFANRFIVLFKWALAYLTFSRGSRLILPPVERGEPAEPTEPTEPAASKAQAPRTGT